MSDDDKQGKQQPKDEASAPWATLSGDRINNMREQNDLLAAQLEEMRRQPVKHSWARTVANIASGIATVFGSAAPSDRESKEKEQRTKNLSLTCSGCQALAAPISGTRNRYRCAKCGRQFAAARHS